MKTFVSLLICHLCLLHLPLFRATCGQKNCSFVAHRGTSRHIVSKFMHMVHSGKQCMFYQPSPYSSPRLRIAVQHLTLHRPTWPVIHVSRPHKCAYIPSLCRLKWLSIGLWPRPPSNLCSLHFPMRLRRRDSATTRP